MFKNIETGFFGNSNGLEQEGAEKNIKKFNSVEEFKSFVSGKEDEINSLKKKSQVDDKERAEMTPEDYEQMSSLQKELEPYGEARQLLGQIEKKEIEKKENERLRQEHEFNLEAVNADIDREIVELNNQLEGLVVGGGKNESVRKERKAEFTAGQQVRVLRTSGKVEDGWQVVRWVDEDQVMVVDKSEKWQKVVGADELLKWQDLSLTQKEEEKIEKTKETREVPGKEKQEVGEISEKTEEILEKLGYVDIEPKEIFEKLNKDDAEKLKELMKGGKEGEIIEFFKNKIKEIIAARGKEELTEEKLEEVAKSLHQAIQRSIEAKTQEAAAKEYGRLAGKFAFGMGKGVAISYGAMIGVKAALVALGVASGGTLLAVGAIGVTAGLFIERKISGWIRGKRAEKAKAKEEQNFEEKKQEIIEQFFQQENILEQMSGIISNEIRRQTSKETLAALGVPQQKEVPPGAVEPVAPEKDEEDFARESLQPVAEAVTEKKETEEGGLTEIQKELYLSCLTKIKAEYPQIENEEQIKNMAIQMALTLEQHITGENEAKKRLEQIKKNKPKVYELIQKFNLLRSGVGPQKPEGMNKEEQNLWDKYKYDILGLAVGSAMGIGLRTSGAGRVVMGALTGIGGGYMLSELLDKREEKKGLKKIAEMIDQSEKVIQDIRFPAEELPKLKEDALLVQSRLELGLLDSDLILKSRAENFIHNVRKVEMANQAALDDLLKKVQENNQNLENKVEEDLSQIQKKTKRRRILFMIGGGVVGGLGTVALSEISKKIFGEKGGKSESQSEEPKTQPEDLSDAIVKQGEGPEHAFIRQIMKDPAKFGFKGDLSDKVAVENYAGRLAHRIALDQGIVKPGPGGINEEIRTKVADRIAERLDVTPDGKISVREIDLRTGALGRTDAIDTYEYSEVVKPRPATGVGIAAETPAEAPVEAPATPEPAAVETPVSGTESLIEKLKISHPKIKDQSWFDGFKVDDKGTITREGYTGTYTLESDGDLVYSGGTGPSGGQVGPKIMKAGVYQWEDYAEAGTGVSPEAPATPEPAPSPEVPATPESAAVETPTASEPASPTIEQAPAETPVETPAETSAEAPEAPEPAPSTERSVAEPQPTSESHSSTSESGTRVSLEADNQAVEKIDKIIQNYKGSHPNVEITPLESKNIDGYVYHTFKMNGKEVYFDGQANLIKNSLKINFIEQGVNPDSETAIKIFESIKNRTDTGVLEVKSIGDKKYFIYDSQPNNRLFGHPKQYFNPDGTAITSDVQQFTLERGLDPQNKSDIGKAYEIFKQAHPEVTQSVPERLHDSALQFVEMNKMFNKSDEDLLKKMTAMFVKDFNGNTEKSKEFARQIIEEYNRGSK